MKASLRQGDQAYKGTQHVQIRSFPVEYRQVLPSCVRLNLPPPEANDVGDNGSEMCDDAHQQGRESVSSKVYVPHRGCRRGRHAKDRLTFGCRRERGGWRSRPRAVEIRKNLSQTKRQGRGDLSDKMRICEACWREDCDCARAGGRLCRVTPRQSAMNVNVRVPPSAMRLIFPTTNRKLQHCTCTSPNKTWIC